MSASDQIDELVAGLPAWQQDVFNRLRRLISEADPDAVEDWKWGTAVWTHAGNLVAVGAFKDHLKANFFQGASLPDRDAMFNAGLEARATRAIDIREGMPFDEPAFQELVRAAAAYNTSKKKR